jgi:hypothetical protein
MKFLKDLFSSSAKSACGPAGRYRSDPALIPSNVKKCEKIISDTWKFIWLFIPKVGGRSLKQLLISKYDGYSVEKGIDEIVAERPECDAYFKFNFVRNPWSRIVSCYVNKIDTDDEKNLNACVTPYAQLYKHMPFREFVAFLHSPEGGDFYPRYANRHWVSQHVFCTDARGAVFCDAVGRIENLQADFAEICRRIGMPVFEVPHLGSTKKPGESDTARYRGFYDADLAESVRRRYARDIELFGYAF